MEKNKMISAIKRYLIICFSITYLSWGSIALYSRIKNVNFNEHTWMLVLYFIGVISPAISVVFIEKIYEKKKYKEIIKGIFRLPVHKRDWIIGLVGVCVLQLLPYFVWGGEILSSFANLIFLVPMFLIIGGMEEIGWRGFWLERELQINKNRIWVVLKIGMVWQLWHLPLFVMLGTYQQLRTNLLAHTLSTLAIAFFLGGLYIKGRSTFLCMMAHSLINSFSDIVVVRQNWAANIIVMAVCVGFFVVMNMCDGQKTVHLVIKEDKSHQNTNVQG